MAAHALRCLVERTGQFLATLTQLPEVRQAQPGPCHQLLDRLLRQHPVYTDLGVLSAQGQLLCSSLPPPDAEEARAPALWRRVVETRGFAVGDIAPGGIPPRPTLGLGYPVLDGGNTPRAVVYALLDLNWLQQFAEEARIPSQAVMLLVDGKGTLLARQPATPRGLGLPARAPVVEAVLRTRAEGVTEAEGIDGVRRLYAFAPLPLRAQGTERNAAHRRM